MTASVYQPLQPVQRRVVGIAWITYASYYLGRVNISTAMPDLQMDLLLSKQQVGLISTGFFWAYAVGQLVNGPLGDRLSPRRFVFVGLLASAAINLAFGSVSIWVLLIGLWTLNGYFQATGWGPILRTLANWLSPKQRTKISGIFGSSFVAGNALTWLLTGWLVAQFGWRVAFWIPAVLLIFFAASWFLLARDGPESDVRTTAEATSANAAAAPRSPFYPAFWPEFGVSGGSCWPRLVSDLCSFHSLSGCPRIS